MLFPFYGKLKWQNILTGRNFIYGLLTNAVFKIMRHVHFVRNKFFQTSGAKYNFLPTVVRHTFLLIYLK